jgi:hypothetical protein
MNKRPSEGNVGSVGFALELEDMLGWMQQALEEDVGASPLEELAQVPTYT